MRFCVTPILVFKPHQELYCHALSPPMSLVVSIPPPAAAPVASELFCVCGCGFQNPYGRCCVFFFNLNILFIYLIAHKQREWQAEAKGEADSLSSREPDGGIDPRTPGS